MDPLYRSEGSPVEGCDGTRITEIHGGQRVADFTDRIRRSRAGRWPALGERRIEDRKQTETRLHCLRSSVLRSSGRAARGATGRAIDVPIRRICDP
jgi:hypothetical protein